MSEWHLHNSCTFPPKIHMTPALCKCAGVSPLQGVKTPDTCTRPDLHKPARPSLGPTGGGVVGVQDPHPHTPAGIAEPIVGYLCTDRTSQDTIPMEHTHP